VIANAGGHAGGEVAQYLVRVLVRKARATKAGLDRLTSARVSRYTLAARAFVWGLSGLIAFIGVIVLLHVPRRALLGAGIGTGLAMLGMGMMVLDCATAVLSWTPTRIVFYSPWRGTRTLRWEDFTHVKFSHAAGWFVLRSRDSVVIRPSMMFGGLVDFFSDMREYASPSLRPQISEALELWSRRAE
jgi:hypothetical protein